ncbi:MAG: response regulator [Planctomycetota bacterium]
MQRDTGGTEARIMVVDDHALVRQGLARLIETASDLMVCAEAENAADALETIDRQHIDLAIVDISLEGANGLELTERIKSRRPGTLVLVLSVHDALFYAQRALRAGASGYVAKHEAADKIMTAIRQVLDGKVYISKSRVDRTASEAPSVGCDSPNSANAAEIRSLEKSKKTNPMHLQA